VCEAGALDPSRTRPAQIFIDDDHLFFNPAQLAGLGNRIIWVWLLWNDGPGGV
jgi:hypothetical protein